MKKYTFHLYYSMNEGKTWTGTNVTVKAESDQGAIMQAGSKYAITKEIKILNVR